MDDYKDIFKTAENPNWIKCLFAIRIVTQPLLEFCQREIEEFSPKGYKSKTTEETHLDAIISRIYNNKLLGKNVSCQDEFVNVCLRVCIFFVYLKHF